MKPGNIVGAIANEVGIESQYIGQIDIRDDHSLIVLPEGIPKKIFGDLKKVWVSGQQLQISRLTKDSGPKDMGPRDKALRDLRPRDKGAKAKAPRTSAARPKDKAKKRYRDNDSARPPRKDDKKKVRKKVDRD